MIETSGPGGAENMLIRLICGLDKTKYESVTCLLKDGWLRGKLLENNIDTFILPQKKYISQHKSTSGVITAIDPFRWCNCQI